MNNDPWTGRTVDTYLYHYFEESLSGAYSWFLWQIFLRIGSFSFFEWTFLPILGLIAVSVVLQRVGESDRIAELKSLVKQTQ